MFRGKTCLDYPHNRSLTINQHPCFGLMIPDRSIFTEISLEIESYIFFVRDFLLCENYLQFLVHLTSRPNSSLRFKPVRCCLNKSNHQMQIHVKGKKKIKLNNILLKQSYLCTCWSKHIPRRQFIGLVFMNECSLTFFGFKPIHSEKIISISSFAYLLVHKLNYHALLLWGFSPVTRFRLSQLFLERFFILGGEYVYFLWPWEILYFLNLVYSRLNVSANVM